MIFTGGIDVRHALGLFDILGSGLLLWSMQRITTKAGFRDAVERWALLRRAVYCLMTVAMFGLGVERFLDEDYRDPNIVSLFQAMMIFGVLVFPVLRAFGLITQDRFLVFDGAQHVGESTGLSNGTPRG